MEIHLGGAHPEWGFSSVNLGILAFNVIRRDCSMESLTSGECLYPYRISSRSKFIEVFGHFETLLSDARLQSASQKSLFKVSIYLFNKNLMKWK